MKKYYVTTPENPKVLKFDVDTMYVFDGGWKASFYWFDKILVSDYVNFEEITEEKAYELIGRMVPDSNTFLAPLYLRTRVGSRSTSPGWEGAKAIKFDSDF